MAAYASSARARSTALAEGATPGVAAVAQTRARARATPRPFIDFEVTASAGRQLVRELRQPLGPVLAHEDEILEPHAAETLSVEPRLDRDDVTRDERRHTD